MRKVEPLERALSEVDAWITGLRRDQSPSRAGTPKLARGREPPGQAQVRAAGRLDRAGRVAVHRRQRRAVPPAARPRVRSRSAARTARCRAVAATAAGPAPTRSSAACTCRPPDGSGDHPLRPRRGRPGRDDRHGRRLADDAAADPRVRHQAGRRGRHRPRVRRGHQDASAAGGTSARARCSRGWRSGWRSARARARSPACGCSTACATRGATASTRSCWSRSARALLLTGALVLLRALALADHAAARARRVPDADAAQGRRRRARRVGRLRARDHLRRLRHADRDRPHPRLQAQPASRRRHRRRPRGRAAVGRRGRPTSCPGTSTSGSPARS